MDKRPNVLFILSDDQGSWALRCAGNSELQTPYLDRLAMNGMRFPNFFCASPVCSPARASLLTGTIPSSHGVLDWLRSGNLDRQRFAEQGKEVPHTRDYIDEDKPIQYLAGKTTYVDVLAQNGYHCALSGKWHLGDSVTPQHGFSSWYTTGGGYCHYFHADMIENGEMTVEHGKYVTDLITNKALDFLEELTKEKAPFYLGVHYTAPHNPWGREHHPEEFISLYETCPFHSTPDVPDHPHLTKGPVYGTERRREYLRGYYAAITAMDRGIGRILNRLEEAGLAENTLVIFTSDNGMNMGHHGIWGKGNGTRPMNMYEESIKVPFLAAMPGVIPKDSLCGQMISACDFFPTLIDFLGLDMGQTEGLPGKSFAQCLLGKSAGNDGFVVVYDEYGPVRMIRTTTHKLICRYPYGPDEFYDLERDPGEQLNQINNTKMEPLIIDMRKRMDRWFSTYADPGVDGTREGVTGSGQLCSAGVHAQKLRKYAPPEGNC